MARQETERVSWGMESPYKNTAYEKDYWAPNSQEAGYVNRQMADIAGQYGQRATELQGQLGSKGLGAGGTIGQFAQAQKITNPKQAAESQLMNEQYGKRFGAEQAQFGRQADYTNQLNQLSLQKALQEQQARYGNRQFQKSGEGQAQSGMGGLMSGIGSALPSILSAFGG